MNRKRASSAVVTLAIGCVLGACAAEPADQAPEEAAPAAGAVGSSTFRRSAARPPRGAISARSATLRG